MAKQDFQVEVGGKPTEVLEIRPADSIPLRFALLLDLSRSNAEFRKSYTRFALSVVGLLRQTIRAGVDRALVIGFRDQVSTAMPFEPDRLSTQLQKADFSGGTALYDAIVFACADLSSTGHADTRQVILLVTDGLDNSSKHTLEEAKQAALRAGVVVYSLNLAWDRTRHGPRVLKELSRITGGRAFEPYHADDLEHAVDELGGDLRSQYMLAFRPMNTMEKHKVRKLKIRLSKESKLRVLAPEAYFAAPN